MSHCSLKKVVSLVFYVTFFMHTIVAHKCLQAAETSLDNVTLRVTTVNPSKTKTQLVPVKIDLPEEVTSRDVVEMSGLSLEYDSSRGIYYVFNNGVELAPQETRIFEIEIKDVWRIPDHRLNEVSNRTRELLGLLEGNERFPDAEEISKSIESKLNEIKTTQRDEAVSRSTHIGIYRTNLKVMDELKSDVERIERMIVSVPGPPVPEIVEDLEVPKTEAPSMATTWIVIFIIITFIGLLSGIFFFTWNRQEKITESLFTQRTDTAFQPPGEGEGQGGKRG